MSSAHYSLNWHWLTTAETKHCRGLSGSHPVTPRSLSTCLGDTSAPPAPPALPPAVLHPEQGCRAPRQGLCPSVSFGNGFEGRPQRGLLSAGWTRAAPALSPPSGASAPSPSPPRDGLLEFLSCHSLHMMSCSVCGGAVSPASRTARGTEKAPGNIH